MAPFIREAYHLTPAQQGLMLSIPIVAGALMRFPLGILSQYIGRKNATLVEMGLIAVAMLFGFFFVKSFNDLLAMGVLLGIAGASFGVAMSLGSGWFPPQHKGLAMGIVGAGNVGTAVAVLLAPPLAQWLGWQAVPTPSPRVAMLIPMATIVVLRQRELQDVEPARRPARSRRLPVRGRRLGVQPDLCRHLRRLHRLHELPPVLLSRPVQGVGKVQAGQLDHARGLSWAPRCACWAAATSPTASAASPRSPGCC